MRHRGRSAKLKVLAIARASRNKTEQGRRKMKNAYVKLLEITSRVVGQAKKQLDVMILRVRQVLRQTREPSPPPEQYF